MEFFKKSQSLETVKKEKNTSEFGTEEQNEILAGWKQKIQKELNSKN